MSTRVINAYSFVRLVVGISYDYISLATVFFFTTHGGSITDQYFNSTLFSFSFNFFFFEKKEPPNGGDRRRT